MSALPPPAERSSLTWRAFACWARSLRACDAPPAKVARVARMAAGERYRATAEVPTRAGLRRTLAAAEAAILDGASVTEAVEQ